MKNIFIILGISVVMACKQSPTTNSDVTQQTPKSDWIELINGKDLTGWKASENTGSWTVVDGMFQAVGSRSHLFYTGEHFRDSLKISIAIQFKSCL